jgi:hypothetical protein
VRTLAEDSHGDCPEIEGLSRKAEVQTRDPTALSKNFQLSVIPLAYAKARKSEFLAPNPPNMGIFSPIKNPHEEK